MHVLFKKRLINQEEFSFGKEYLLSEGDDTFHYQEMYLDAIPVLYKAMSKGMLNRDEYHDAVMLTLRKKRELYDAYVLCSGAITFENYLHDLDLVHRPQHYGVNYMQHLAELLSGYGYQVSQVSLTRLCHKVEYQKGDSCITISQSYGLFGPSKIRVDDGKELYRFPPIEAFGMLNEKLKQNHGKL